MLTQQKHYKPTENGAVLININTNKQNRQHMNKQYTLTEFIQQMK